MISIVMAYVNRLDLLDHTLYTICQSAHSDFEVVIVDDFSRPDQDPTQLLNKFPAIKIKVLKMSEIIGNRSYFNPCVPYNVGFSAARGDKIIIQNPECCHMGDVVSYTEQNLTDDVYLSYHCYASTQADLALLRSGKPIQYLNNPVSAGGCWYNHREYRPESFHFTTAITRKNLAKLNGFDERFSQGRAWDDIELVRRIKNLGLVITYVDHPHTIHQYHTKTVDKHQAALINKNRTLYHQLVTVEPGVINVDNDGKNILGVFQ